MSMRLASFNRCARDKRPGGGTLPLDAGQGHVFAHWDQCTSSERLALLAQLGRIDPARVSSVFARSMADFTSGQSQSLRSREEVQPLKAHDSLATAGPDKVERWRRRGLQVAAAGQLAVVLLAGGQGTRLGSSDPKGMYDLGLPSGRTLFRLQAERLLKLGRLAGRGGGYARVPWYIMTSPSTHAATVRYFTESGFFGLNPTDVTFFQQGWLPCFDNHGKIIMQSRGEVATAGRGVGGVGWGRGLCASRSRSFCGSYKLCVGGVFIWMKGGGLWGSKSGLSC